MYFIARGREDAEEEHMRERERERKLVHGTN
jgi:hypothetical protein